MKEAEAVGLITFGGQQKSQPRMFEVFYETLEGLAQFVDHIFVVDDGTGMLASLLANNSKVTLKSLPENTGKAGAVRQALGMIVNTSLPANTVILMTDYDRDVVIGSAAQPLLAAVRDGADVAIGNRHSSHPENTYRGAVNLIQTVIGELFGFDGIMDSVSGTCAYTLGFADKFLRLSRSKGWGLNAEMFVIAGVLYAHAISVPLPQTRNRAESTDRRKLIAVLDGMLLHADALRSRGFGKLVDFLSDIRYKLDEGQRRFVIDLSPLGKPITLTALWLPNDAYALEIP